MTTIFTKIIEGEIPSHRVYEDDWTYAFLDINPRQPGHALVVPKTEVDYLFDLDDEAYQMLWGVCRTVSEAIKAVTKCERVFVVVAGFEIPHAHVHLIPANHLADFPFPPAIEQTNIELAAMAERIASAARGK